MGSQITCLMYIHHRICRKRYLNKTLDAWKRILYIHPKWRCMEGSDGKQVLWNFKCINKLWPVRKFHFKKDQADFFVFLSRGWHNLLMSAWTWKSMLCRWRQGKVPHNESYKVGYILAGKKESYVMQKLVGSNVLRENPQSLLKIEEAPRPFFNLL